MKLTKGFLLCFLAFSLSLCFGQVQTIYVKPIQTDGNYSPTEDSSSVSRNSTFQLNKLFLFIGGTGSSSSTDYIALRLYAANLGYDCINLSYPNDVAAASLTNSTDSMVFDKYRQEVCFGTPVSDAVTIDTLNSIYTRTIKLLHYLQTTYPSHGWDQYLLSPTSLDWSKIVVGGHSQGAGHACYLAKQYEVERVLMFSGPNDYSNHFSNAANWLRAPGSTAMSKHFVYLSLLDEIVPFNHQRVNLQGLGLYPLYDTTYVDISSSPYGNSRCLYTTQAPGIALLHHNATIKLSSINNAVWTYMLTATATAGIDENAQLTGRTIYPNPTSHTLFVSTNNSIEELNYSIAHLSGHTMKSGILVRENGAFAVDISDLHAGIYVLLIDGEVFRFVKE